MNELESKLEKYLLELPLNFQETIKDSGWRMTANKIGLAGRLNAEQLASLEAETMMVLYGVEEAQNYIANLTTELNIDQEKAASLASEVTREIFEPIENKAQKSGKGAGNPTTPIIITQETKRAAIEELSERVRQAKQGGASVSPQVPEKAPEIHPMIEPGETAHDVPHIEQPVQKAEPQPVIEPEPAIAPLPLKPEEKPKPEPVQVPPVVPSVPIPEKPQAKPAEPAISAPNSRYPDGKDPYREPLV